MMLGGTGMVRVLSPITLSLEVHWEDVSELSVAATQDRDKDTLILDQTPQPSINCRQHICTGFCLFLKLLCAGF